MAEAGLSPESREFAQGALLALSDTELTSKEGQKHVMLSCASNCLVKSLLRRCLMKFRVRTDQWDVQTIVQRINESLIRRGYVKAPYNIKVHRESGATAFVSIKKDSVAAPPQTSEAAPFSSGLPAVIFSFSPDSACSCSLKLVLGVGRCARWRTTRCARCSS